MPEVNKHFSAKLFAYDNNLNQGDIIKIQILKFANRVHPIYGKLLIDQKYFDNLIANFKNNVSDDEIPINMEHDRTKAQARMKNVYQEGDFLFCDAELTKDWAENLNGRHYKYFSAEIADKYQNRDTLKWFDNVLVGGALTNYPYFNGMEKIVASNPEDTIENKSLSTKTQITMIKELLQKFSTQAVLSFADKAELLKAFNDATPEEQAEVATEVETAVEKTEEKTDEEKEELKKELSMLKTEKKFSETKQMFSTIHAFNQPEEEAQTEAAKVLKAFSNLADEDVALVQKFFSNYQAVIETLTGGQLSQSFSKKEEKEEETPVKGKGGKTKISEEKFAKLCKGYAKDKDMDINKAYEKLKGEYEITKE